MREGYEKNFITFFKCITMFVGLIVRGKYMGIFHIILYVPQNIIMDQNNVMFITLLSNYMMAFKKIGCN